MYQLKRTGMKVLKILHLFFVCCWIGGAMALLTINLSNDKAVAEGMLYGINMASHVVDMWVVIILGAGGCSLTGLIYSLLTPWGFLKHKWIIIKWILTISCISSGVFFLGVYESILLELSQTLGTAALSAEAYMVIKAKHLYLTYVQIFSLVFMVTLSVLKPWGKKAKG